MPRIAMIFPYFRTRALTEILFPPLGVASLAGQFLKMSLETQIIDCTFASMDDVEHQLIAYQPDIVGIYSMVTLYDNALRIAKVVRERNPEALIVGGGPLLTLFPESYGEHFDAIFRGEVDLSFPRFCQDYFQANATRDTLDELPLETYEGLYIRKNDLKLSNETKHYSEVEIQSFPIPDRTHFDHQVYQEAWLATDGTKTTSIITTLGCPFSCDFCSKPIFGSLFRHRNLDAVFEEIQQIRSLGYDSLWIADDTFTLDISFLEQFCQRIARGGISWTCLSRSNKIDESITRMMKDAGCRRVYLGLESGSQRTLELMNKKVRLEEGINAVHQFRKAGIEVAAFFIVGYPGETIDSIEETFRLSLSLPLDSISFNVPFPLPGSALFERVGKSGKFQDWKLENDATFVYESEFDEQWIRSRIGQTMEAFLEKGEERSVRKEHTKTGLLHPSEQCIADSGKNLQKNR